VLDSVDGIGVDRIPVRDEHLPEVVQPGAILEERPDVSDYEHGVVVGEDIHRRARVRASAGEEHRANRVPPFGPPGQATDHVARVVAGDHDDPLLRQYAAYT
jgi:hypothetical protein